ncbi:thioredoxin family protein [Intestinibacter sp.]|uniref:thioredoxin family protein n=1 Tax=Intestinibacter sp. TaxID=1965304 RepID=UPI003F160287
MGLFNFGKKKEKKVETPSCCCNGNSKTFEASSDSCCCNGESCKITSIKVLGAGCKSCHEQYENVKSAIKAMGLAVEVEYITDMEKVMAYGVMSMPAIVVNEKIVSMGKVLKTADVEKLLYKLGY